MPGAREAVIEPFNVGPACVGERFIFGAERPGYPSDPVDDEAVDEWIALMRSEGVERVVCLLDREQLADYAHDLRDAYREHSGEDRVLWVPISDFSLVDEQTLATVLAFPGSGSCVVLQDEGALLRRFRSYRSDPCGMARGCMRPLPCRRARGRSVHPRAA